jgi:hypothetical protein
MAEKKSLSGNLLVACQFAFFQAERTVIDKLDDFLYLGLALINELLLG